MSDVARSLVVTAAAAVVLLSGLCQTGFLSAGHSPQVANPGLTPSASTTVESGIGPFASLRPPGSVNSGVSRTLVLSNDTLLPGNVRVSPGGHPAQEAFDSKNSLMYASNSGSDSVLVLDPTTGEFLQPLLLNVSPSFLAIDPLNGLLYLDNSSTSSVEAVNVTSGAVMAYVTVGQFPQALAYDPSAGVMVVAEQGSNELSFINATSNSFEANVSAPGGPWGVAFDSRDGGLYVTDRSAGNSSWSFNCTGEVSEYAGNGTFSHLRDLWVGYSPTGIAFDPVNGDLYVANSYLCGVSVLDPTTDAVLTTIAAPAGELLGIPVPWFVAVDPVTDRVFVTVTEVIQGLDGFLMVIDGASNRLVTSVVVGGKVTDVVDDPSLGQVLISDPSAMTVAAVSTTSLAVEAEFFAGTEPGQTIFNPVNGLVYVLDPPARDVFAIDPRTDRVVDRIQVGEYADSLTYDPVTGNVFVGLFYESEIVAINVTTDVAGLQVTDVDRNGYTGDNPAAVAFDASVGRLFNSEGFPKGISANVWHGFVDARAAVSGNLQAAIELGAVPTGNTLALDSSGQHLYVPTSSTNGTGIAVVDASRLAQTEYVLVTSTQIAHWILGNDSILFDPGNDRVYLGDFGGGSVSVLDSGRNLTLVDRLPLPSPTALAYDAARGYVYVASQNGTVTVVNGSTSTIVATAPVGELPDGLALDPSTNQLFVANNGSGTLSILDLGTALSPLVVSVSVNESTVPFAGNVTFSASATGGSGPLTFAFLGMPAGCRSANVSTFTCRPGQNGSFLVSVVVSTPFDQSATASARLTVLPPVYTVPFEEYGLAPGVLWYVSLGDTSSVSTTPNVTFHLPNGTYTFETGSVSGYDLLTPTWNEIQVAGVPATTWVGYREASPPSPFELLTFGAYPSRLTAGEVVQFLVLTANATGPVAYAYSGLPPGCVSRNDSTLNCTPSQAGTYDVELTATDSAGRNVTAAVTVLVVAAAAPAASGVGWEAAAVAGLGACLVLAAAVVVLWRRRDRDHRKE